MQVFGKLKEQAAIAQRCLEPGRRVFVNIPQDGIVNYHKVLLRQQIVHMLQFYTCSSGVARPRRRPPLKAKAKGYRTGLPTCTSCAKCSTMYCAHMYTTQGIGQPRGVNPLISVIQRLEQQYNVRRTWSLRAVTIHHAPPFTATGIRHGEQ